MNRRDLFKGLAAALVAVNIPLPVEQLLALPDTQAITYLKRVQQDLLNKIINPPCIMHEDGKTEIMPTKIWQEALSHVNSLITELGAA